VLASGWYGFLAPAATPQPIVRRMESEIARALADAEVKAKLAKLGLEARPTGAADFGRFVEDETAKWGSIIKETGLKGEP
jgi:tripartite-type tricarboxylate transporter receptor subunit TctC